MIDLSYSLEIKRVKLSSAIIWRNEFSHIKEGTAHFNPKLSHEFDLAIYYNEIILGKDKYLCNFSISGIPLGNQNFRKIKDQIFNLGTYDTMAASFYLEEFYDFHELSGSISYYKDNLYNIFIDYELFIKNFISEPIRIKNYVEAVVKYEGLNIQNSILSEPTPTTKSIKESLKKYIDVSSYKELVKNSEYSYLLIPK